MPDDRPELLTIQQAADYLGLSRRTIELWMRNGKLPAVRLGPRTRRIRADDLAALIQPDQPQG